MTEMEMRYKRAIDNIGIGNLAAMPDEVKRPLKEARSLPEKVRVLETLELTLKKQGII